MAELLADRVWPEVAARGRQLLIVPLGSLEQHGPHLPLDTDTVVADALARAVGTAVAGSAVAPPLPLGASGEHAGFPGTLSIGREALELALLELARDAGRDWGALLFVNGHGGNAAAVARAVGRAVAEGRRVASWSPRLPGGDAHAGRTETSLLLHLDPERVRLPAAEPGSTAPLAAILPTLRAAGVRAASPNGVLGDPTGASAAEGAQLMQTLVTDALTVTRTAFPHLVVTPSVDGLG